MRHRNDVSSVRNNTSVRWLAQIYAKQGTLRRTVDIARPRDMKFFSRVRASDGFNILERYVPRSAARAADSFCERIFGFADALKEITPA